MYKYLFSNNYSKYMKFLAQMAFYGFYYTSSISWNLGQSKIFNVKNLFRWRIIKKYLLVDKISTKSSTLLRNKNISLSTHLLVKRVGRNRGRESGSDNQGMVDAEQEVGILGQRRVMPRWENDLVW